MRNLQLTEKLNQILTKDKRYKLGAYQFINEALAHAGRVAGLSGHLTGQQLLAGFIDLSRRKYGSMARLVLESWGIFRGEDVGEVVFNLIEAGVLNKRPEDSKEDFELSTSFIALFDKADID